MRLSEFLSTNFQENIEVLKHLSDNELIHLSNFYYTGDDDNLRLFFDSALHNFDFVNSTLKLPNNITKLLIKLNSVNKLTDQLLLKFDYLDGIGKPNNILQLKHG